jgi:hypothetical protein
MVNALETSKEFDEEQGTSLEVDGFGSKPLVLGWLVNSEMLALEGGTNSSSNILVCTLHWLPSCELGLGCKCSKKAFQRF